MLIIELTTFSLAWWLGLFLLRREEATPAMYWSAAGLIAYALALMLSSLSQFAGDRLADLLRLQVPILLAPLFFWAGALWYLRSDLLLLWGKQNGTRSKRQIAGLIFIATVSFALGVGLIFLPILAAFRQWIIIAISLDLLVLGYAVSFLDAFEQGERFLPDFLYSLTEAEIAGLLFGGQIALVIWFATGPTFPMVLALFGVTATAILTRVFSRQIQDRFDALVYRRFPQLRQERTALRALTDALPRSQPRASDWSEEEFSKLTRQALSNLSDIPKLAASPLIHLDLIHQRLTDKGVEINTLSRAAELKAVLIGSINKLKPSKEAEFGQDKAWRHYNVLYFPYVRGLRPYGRDLTVHSLETYEREALDWFIQEVPRRTLFNWQSAASKVVARDLQEQSAVLRA